MLLLAVVLPTLSTPALASEETAEESAPAVAQAEGNTARRRARKGRRGGKGGQAGADASAPPPAPKEGRPGTGPGGDELARPYAMVQIWGTAYDQDEDVQADATGYGDPEQDAGFSFKRARLGLVGDHEGLQYEVIFGVSAPYDAFDTEDGDIQLVDANLGWSKKGIGFEVGRAKVPFSRDQMMSSAELTFTERGFGAEHVAPDRALGANLFAGYKGAKVTLGVFNAGGDLFGDDTPGKTLVGRLEYQRGGDSYRTFTRSKDLAYGLGVGGFTTDAPGLKTLAGGGDILVRWQGAALLFDAAFATVSPDTGDEVPPGVYEETARLALTGELSYAIADFQPAVRYTSFSDDVLGDWSQVLAGVTWHGMYAGDGERARDRLRVGAGYVHRIEPTPRDNDTVRLWAQFRL